MRRNSDQSPLEPESASTRPAASPHDQARERDATAIAARLEPAAKPSFKDRVAALRAMSRETFVAQTREVASHILAAIQTADGPLPESIRPMNASDTRAKNDYLSSLDTLRDAEIAEETPEDAIVLDRSFEPSYPVSVLIKAGDKVAHGAVHWALWQVVEKALSPEDQDFIWTLRAKAGIEESISNYQQARETLVKVGIDLDTPRLFADS